MGKHFDIKFKEQVINDYKSGNYGGYEKITKMYGLFAGTVSHWVAKDKIQGNQINDIKKKLCITKISNHCRNIKNWLKTGYCFIAQNE